MRDESWTWGWKWTWRLLAIELAFRGAFAGLDRFFHWSTSTALTVLSTFLTAAVFAYLLERRRPLGAPPILTDRMRSRLAIRISLLMAAVSGAAMLGLVLARAPSEGPGSLLVEFLVLAFAGFALVWALHAIGFLMGQKAAKRS